MQSENTTRQDTDGISAERVKRSAFFQSALELAAEYLRRPGKLFDLAERSAKKFVHLPEPLVGLRETLAACVRLVRAWAGGYYREIPTSSLVSIIAALIYFVTPIDLVPDFIIALGLVDDAALLGWVLSSVRRDIDQFTNWESLQARGMGEELTAGD